MQLPKGYIYYNVLLLFTLGLIVPFDLEAQHIIIQNKTFNGTPGIGRVIQIDRERIDLTDFEMPKSWNDCGSKLFPNESPPDIHSSETNIFGVRVGPEFGNAIGMVVRPNGSYESISQTLESAVLKNKTYQIEISVSSQSEMISAVIHDKEQKQINFNQPLIVELWLGNKMCENEFFIGSTNLIDHLDWGYYDWTFKADKDYRILYIRVAKSKNTMNSTEAGHVLIDWVSDIKCLDP